MLLLLIFNTLFLGKIFLRIFLLLFILLISFSLLILLLLLFPNNDVELLFANREFVFVVFELLNKDDEFEFWFWFPNKDEFPPNKELFVVDAWVLVKVNWLWLLLLNNESFSFYARNPLGFNFNNNNNNKNGLFEIFSLENNALSSIYID